MRSLSTRRGLFFLILHVTLTLPLYGRLSLEALWFAGSGLAVVCCALMNVVALKTGSPSSRWAAVGADLLIAGFFAAAWPLLPGPQVAAGFIIFVILAAYFGPITLWRDKAAQRMARA